MCKGDFDILWTVYLLLILILRRYRSSVGDGAL